MANKPKAFIRKEKIAAETMDIYFFTTECLDNDPGHKELMKDIFKAYLKWKKRHKRTLGIKDLTIDTFGRLFPKSDTFRKRFDRRTMTKNGHLGKGIWNVRINKVLR